MSDTEGALLQRTACAVFQVHRWQLDNMNSHMQHTLRMSLAGHILISPSRRHTCEQIDPVNNGIYRPAARIHLHETYQRSHAPVPGIDLQPVNGEAGFQYQVVHYQCVGSRLVLATARRCICKSVFLRAARCPPAVQLDPQ